MAYMSSCFIMLFMLIQPLFCACNFVYCLFCLIYIFSSMFIINCFFVLLFFVVISCVVCFCFILCLLKNNFVVIQSCKIFDFLKKIICGLDSFPSHHFFF